LSKSFAGKVTNSPIAYSMFLSAQIFAFGPSYEIVIRCEHENEKTKRILNELNTLFVPNKVVLVVPDNKRDEIISVAPFTGNYEKINGSPTIYVCKNYVCSLPTTDIGEMKKLLEK